MQFSYQKTCFTSKIFERRRISQAAVWQNIEKQRDSLINGVSYQNISSFSTKLLQPSRIELKRFMDFKVRPFSRQKGSLLPLRKCFLTETNETNIGHLDSLFFLFAATKAFSFKCL